MTEGNDAFDRNLERLIRAAAAPPPRPEQARREFLSRLEGKSPKGRWIAMAASLLVAVGLAYALLQQPPAASPGPSPATRPASPVEAVSPASEGKGPEPVAPRPALAAREGPGAPMVAKDATMTVSCAPWRASDPSMRLEGTVAFPDHTLLLIKVDKVVERAVAGRLAGSVVGSLSSRAEVDERRFRYSPPWQGPGRYVVTISIEPDQRPDLVEPLKRVPRRPSVFEFTGWEDGLSARLLPQLQELDAASRDCLDLVERMEKLTRTEAGWVKEWRNRDIRGADPVLTPEAQALMKDCTRLMTRIERMPAAGLYSAAHGELALSFQKLIGSTRSFVWESGKFAGAQSYHSGKEPLKTHRDEPFGFEVLRKYLQELPAIGGRECALWMLKDLRRGAARESYAELLKAGAKHEGLGPFAERLSKAGPDELDGLEAEIRAGK